MVQQFLLDGVPVEPGNRAQPPGNSGPGTAMSFQIAGEALNIGTADAEQPQLVDVAPAGELAQVQLVCLAGQPALVSTGGSN